MSNATGKRAVLAALSFKPDFSALATFPPLESKNGQHLLRWLDRSGLSLGFLRRLQTSEAAPSMSAEWLDTLAQRLARNVLRTRDMLAEFKRVNDAFRAHVVAAVALKGFTLAPDFCEDLTLRHQTDFDFLIHQDSVERAAVALQRCGYSTSQLNKTAETCFLTPLRHIPSADDDLYALQHHRQVDIHTSIFEQSPWIQIEVPQDWLEHAQTQSIHGIDVLTLSLVDKFILQVFHAFKHSFRSWIRPSWLLEIGRCMETHRDDTALWDQVIERAGHTRLTKYIFAFVLELVTRLFRTPIPVPLRCWTAETTSLAVRAWLDAFAVDWAISDWPGSLTNLLLAAEFIPDRSLRLQYCRSRLFPRKSHASMSAVATSRNMFLKLQTTRLSYMAHRAAVHLKDMASLPMQHLRWKRALYMSSKAPVRT
jgi:putative nucleotidyltransferase-like protein